MDKKAKYVLVLVVLLLFGVMIGKTFFKSGTETGGIDTNPDYAQSLAEAKSQGQPVFLEFYSDA